MIFPGSKSKQKERIKNPDNVGRTPVYSYHSLRNTKPEKSPDKTAVGGRVQRFFAIIVKVVFLSIILFELWLKPVPNVTIISLPGTVSRTEKTYQEGILSEWGNSIFNHSKVTLQSNKITDSIKNKYPELEAVDIELPLLGNLANVVVTPATPAMLLVTQSGAFYIDSNGKTLARTDQVKGNALGGLTSVRDDSGIVPEPGKIGLEKQTIKTADSLQRLANSIGLDVEVLSLPLAHNEINIHLRGKPYIVKFALDQSPRQGIGALSALLDKFNRESIYPKTYIDLRIPDKAFYK